MNINSDDFRVPEGKDVNLENGRRASHLHIRRVKIIKRCCKTTSTNSVPNKSFYTPPAAMPFC